MTNSSRLSRDGGHFAVFAPNDCCLCVLPPTSVCVQIKDAVRDGLRAVKNVIDDKAVVLGAGAFEVAAAQHLRETVKKQVGVWLCACVQFGGVRNAARRQCVLLVVLLLTALAAEGSAQMVNDLLIGSCSRPPPVLLSG